MSQVVKNFYTLSPMDLKNGDVLVCKLVAHVTEMDGQLFYRLYRCESEEREGSADIPQGSRIYNEHGEVAKHVFPVLRFAYAKEDN